jgi:hypothetical protein
MEIEKIVWLNIASGGWILLQPFIVIFLVIQINGEELNSVFGIEVFRISFSIFLVLEIVMSCVLQYLANTKMTIQQLKDLFGKYMISVLVLSLAGIFLMLCFVVLVFLMRFLTVVEPIPSDLNLLTHFCMYVQAFGAGSSGSLPCLPVWFLSYYIIKVRPSPQMSAQDDDVPEGNTEYVALE